MHGETLKIGTALISLSLMRTKCVIAAYEWPVECRQLWDTRCVSGNV